MTTSDAPPTHPDIAAGLAALTAAAPDVRSDPQTLDRYLIDGRRPALAVQPATIDELAATLSAADSAGLAVAPQGGRTAIGLGNPPAHYDLALDTRSLDAVIDHVPDDFTITVQGGMPFGALQSLLAQHGQFVPLDVPFPNQATVGGSLAAARNGPRRGAFGGPRDWLIGCSAVLPRGVTVHGGGRVVKNVSGYDLCKLFTGSFGTLGCIVEATFKLRPLPTADGTLTIPVGNFDAALELGRRIALTVPGLQAVTVLDTATARALGVDEAAVLVRAAGVEGAVPSTLNHARATAHAGPDLQPDPTDPDLWQRLTDLEGTPPQGSAVLVRCAPPPASLRQAAAALRTATDQARLWAYADSGLLFAHLPAPTPALLPAIVATARQGVEALGGSLVVEHAPLGEKRAIDLWGPPGEGLAIMRRLKHEFDPNGTLNPGRFVGGI